MITPTKMRQNTVMICLSYKYFFNNPMYIFICFCTLIFYYVIINKGIKSISSPPCEISIILKDIC
jgi:hypothetical protein